MLERHIPYIFKDKPIAALKFGKDVLDKIEEISKNPLSYRKSKYFDKENIRDLIF